MLKIVSKLETPGEGYFCPVTSALENVCNIVEKQAQDIALYKKVIYAIVDFQKLDEIEKVLNMSFIPFSLSTAPARVFLRNLMNDMSRDIEGEDE